MPKPRTHIRLSQKAHDLLEEMTRKPGVHKSAILEAALWAYVDPTLSTDAHKTILQRLDGIDIRLNSVERDAALSVETLGQFVLYWLMRTEPLPDGERDAAHSLGQRRFDYFIEQVARKIGTDARLASRVFSPLRDLKSEQSIEFNSKSRPKPSGPNKSNLDR